MRFWERRGYFVPWCECECEWYHAAYNGTEGEVEVMGMRWAEWGGEERKRYLSCAADLSFGD